MYGLTPVVISATLGSICVPLAASIPPPIAAKARPSLGLGGGTDLGVLSLLAMVDRVWITPLPWMLCGGAALVYGELLKPELLSDEVWECPRGGETLCPGEGVSSEALEREKGTTPARRAMSASPSCQCMASAARHGTAISSATLDQISGLNLRDWVSL